MPVLKPLSGSGDAPQQYKQPSRKGKKAWRKNVDVTEVEEGLEELNKQIIQGGVVAEKASDQLFAIDSVGDADIRKRINKNKTLKSDQIIAQRSAVPALPTRKRTASKLGDGVLPEKRQRTDYVPHKELMRLRDVADGHHESTIAIKDAGYDVWDAAPETPPVHELFRFIPEEQKAKAPRTLKHLPISLAANGKAIPAVKKPSGGFSYNPPFSDYAARVTEEGEKAVAAERKRLDDEEAVRQKQEAAARSAAVADAAAARAELSEWEEDSGWEGIESGPDDDRPTAKRPERKTRVQRNKIKRRKEEEAQAKHEAAMKKHKEQARRIKQLAKEVTEKEKALQLAKAEASDSASEGEDTELRRRRLGKFRLPEKDLELVLPDELQESLRLLKPEGNLLKDRYRSLLVRGKMETRRHIPFKKQAKTKMTEKWSYKDFTLW